MRRSTTGMLATSALLGVALLAPTPAMAVEDEFTAEATGSQLFLDAVNFGALTAEPPVGSLAQLEVAPTEAQALTEGLADDVNTRAFGQNLRLALADQQLPVDQLATALQTAPPNNAEPEVAQLIPLDAASPLLTGSVLESTAWARALDQVQCPDVDQRSLISEGTSTTTDLGVLDLSQFQEDMGSLVSVRDGGGQGTLQSASGTYVLPGGEVLSEARAQTASVNIANQVDIEVVSPRLTATAGGPDGPAVDYEAEIRVNGERLAATEENRVQLDALQPLLQPVDEMVLNEAFGPLDEVLSQITTPLAEALPLIDAEQLTPTLLTDLIQNQDVDLDQIISLHPTAVITAGTVDADTDQQDGVDSATATATAVTVEIHVVGTLLETGDVVGDPAPILTLDLMPMSVDVTAPTGGLQDCGDVAADEDPFANLTKDASTQTVQPGGEFDYIITVPNDGRCPLQVTVEDVVTGPEGFTITDASRDGAITGDTVTWEVERLDPDDQVQLELTIQVPNQVQDGATFTDTVTATGTVIEGDFDLDGDGTAETTCGDGEFTGDFTLPNEPTVDAPNEGDVGEDTNLPRTGGGLALLALGSLGAAAALRRRA